MSHEQREGLKNKPVRRRLSELNHRMLAEMSEPLQVVTLNRPFISVVREDRIDQLQMWAARRNILIM